MATAARATPAESEGHAPTRRGRAPTGLALSALGVVFGDIGTSPLYALQTVIGADHNAVKATRADVFGVISMVFWSSQLVPAALEWARDKEPEMDRDPEKANYFLSSLRLTADDVPSLPRWHRRLFLGLSANAANRTTVFRLPSERTVVVGGTLEI